MQQVCRCRCDAPDTVGSAHTVLLSFIVARYTQDGVATALHSGGAIADTSGIMPDGAGVPTGTPLPDPPLIEAISEDPYLR